MHLNFRKYFILSSVYICLTLLILSSFQHLSSPNLYPTPLLVINPTGTYILTRENGSGCILKMLEQPTDKPFRQLDFELLCMRGDPSYNSGYAMATIFMADNKAVYFIQYDGAIPCSIIFEFQESAVQVEQIGTWSDCGFGGSVYANGIYELKDHAPPVLGCMREYTPCVMETPNTE